MKAVDLFAGCGGLSLGLMNSGINIAAAFENWNPALSIYKNNFKHPAINLDLNQVDSAISSINLYKPDIIAGGPPCQDFSSAGKRNENGGRGNLTLSFAKIIVSVRPQWFLMENVERTLKTTIYKDSKLLFMKSGYGLTEVVLDASLCGVPQKRKRLFLIGKLGEEDNFLMKSILASLAQSSLTLRQYFGNKLNTNYYYRHARSYERRGIFSIDEPSPTIRGVNRPIPPNYKVHPADATSDLSKVRPLTTHERAAIQTFPDNFVWPISNKSELEQIIGNAVPVNLAQFIGSIIYNYETKTKKISSKRKSITNKQSKLEFA